MFWNKKSSPSFPQDPSLQDLASRLGVERRTNVRVFYPERTTATMPAISFVGNAMRVHDLSVGGCCLIDLHETLGSNVGNELTLSLHFADGTEDVRARIVGRINDRRHVQFMDLKPARQEQLKAQMAFGIRAIGMKPGLKVVEQGPSLAARELWSSMKGDAVIVEDGVHRLAQAEIGGEIYYFYREAWPVDRNLQVVPTLTLNNLILFLANINYRSAALRGLLSQLEELALEART
jgi:hypothetical protein